MISKTLFDKVWDLHIVDNTQEQKLLYIDLHLVHEVTSPQAFSLIREQKRKVRRPDLTFATADHNIPTENRDEPIKDYLSRKQVEFLQKNCEEFDIPMFDLNHPDNGIVHIIGPELGLTLPGKTIVCGDSHTSTHGAFGALAFGIGSSEITHVLATQTLPQTKPKTMNIHLKGHLKNNITSKDIILYIIRTIGTNGGSGYVVEFTGEAIEKMSMEARMTLCNMAIEAGARSAMIAPDETTFNYLKERKYTPKNEEWEEALSFWRSLKTDEDAEYDHTIHIDVSNIEPQITWGTNPGQVISIGEAIPSYSDMSEKLTNNEYNDILTYLGVKEKESINDLSIDKVFIGSCTNSRMEDLRLASKVVKGYKVNDAVHAIVVPGSYHVKRKAEEEGLDVIFKDAGFEWRDPGCSMCLGMNPDYLKEGERCASTSNRNFEGRQGKGGRSHLVSPLMAAAAAINGRFTDVRKWQVN